MKLVASLIVRNEMGRYLPLVIEHLLEFCDEIRVLDDRSDDGTAEWLAEQRGVAVQVNPGPSFFEHEGRARQALLRWTLDGQPTHVLAIDSDEFVGDGSHLRAQLARSHRRQTVFRIALSEVWRADANGLDIRSDGGWRTRRVPLVFRIPPGRAARSWKIRNRALACGREPEQVRALASRGRATDLGVDLFHFGWANEAARAARHERYAVHDGGDFHAKRHLDSILWPDEKVRLERRTWPAGLEGLRERIVEATGVVAA